MASQSKPHAPLGVVLLALFYAFGAIILLVSRFIGAVEIGRMMAERHALPASAGPLVFPVLVVLALALSYGLYSLSRWGFWLTIGYLLYFGAASLVAGDASSAGNLIWSVLVIVYLFLVRRRFFSPTVPSPAPGRSLFVPDR